MRGKQLMETTESTKRPGNRSLLLAAGALVIGLIGGFGVARATASNSLPEPEGNTYPGQSRGAHAYLTMRSAPYLEGYYEGAVQFGDPVQVSCKVTGQEIAWNELRSTDWYRLDNGSYSSSVFITLDNQWDIPTCDGPVPEASTDLRETAIADVHWSYGNPVSVYAEPSAAAEVVGEVPFGARVTLLCHAYGPDQDGNEILWNRIDEGFVPDSPLNTGSATPIVFAC